MVKLFEDFHQEYEDFLSKYDIEWKKKFPELTLFKIEKYHDNGYVWFYGLQKEVGGYEVDLFIEIHKQSLWNITFELIKVGISDDNTLNQEEKHYLKNNLDYKSLEAHLAKICTYIKEWNENTFNKEKIFLS